MNKKQLLETVSASGKPTIVDFWAPWCAPCRTTKPILEKLAKEFKEGVNFLPINTDENQLLMQELKVFGIPTVIIIDEGNIVGRITGAQQEKVYRQMFESITNGQIVQFPISPLNRILRLGIGTVSIIFAFQTSTWWLLVLGFVILFAGIYDRCPIWKAFTGYLKNYKKAP